jgi:hypothetical protein
LEKVLHFLLGSPEGQTRHFQAVLGLGDAVEGGSSRVHGQVDITSSHVILVLGNG